MSTWGEMKKQFENASDDLLVAVTPNYSINLVLPQKTEPEAEQEEAVANEMED